jgi:hypothetical protein
MMLASFMDALSVAWDTTNIATLAHCDAVRRGHPLHHRAFSKPRDGLTKEGTMIYFARKRDCEAARSSLSAARTRPHERSRAPFMKRLAKRRARSQRPRPTPSHVGSERRLRCFSLI